MIEVHVEFLMRANSIELKIAQYQRYVDKIINGRQLTLRLSTHTHPHCNKQLPILFDQNRICSIRELAQNQNKQ